MIADLAVLDLGQGGYSETLELQRGIAAARIDGSQASDVLLFVEHPPVVTVGRSAAAEHLTTSPEALARLGVDLFEIDRGGDVTFHGPGQLVGYLIFDLSKHREDLHWFLRTLECALIEGLGSLGVTAETNPGYTGVWVGDRKIASIGIHVKQWVTWHGFALNVTTDLSFFDLIVPCGIQGVEMTSVERELSSAPADLRQRATDAMARAIAEAFHLRVVHSRRSEVAGTPSNSPADPVP